MNFEFKQKIFEDYENGITLRPLGKAESFNFSVDSTDTKHFRLFAVGETELFYFWKNEPNNSLHYHQLTDALDIAHANKAQYALNLSSVKPEKYIRRAYKKLLWPPRLAYLDLTPIPDDYRFGIFAMAKELKIHEGGYLRMRLDVRYKKDGVNRNSVMNEPDFKYVINLDEGSYSYKEFALDINLPKDKVASVGVFVEGVNYSGEVFVERPFLKDRQRGYNLLIDFSAAVSGKDDFNWTAQHLSKKEWPKFRLSLNGKTFFEGEVFERCHINSEWEAEIPRELIQKDNELSVELISEYHDPLPYTIRELSLLHQKGGDFAVIAASENGVQNGKAHALIRTEKENLRLFAEYHGEVYGKKEFFFKEKGLHGISFNLGEASCGVTISLSDGNRSEDITVKHIVLKEEDNVITGTGDLIYVHLDEENVEEYLSWYLSNSVGNLLTIRPAYRWSGTRTLEPEVWKIVTRVLSEWDISFVNMIDGRELPGISLNPDENMIYGERMLGWQEHERDGANFYWRRYSAPDSLFSKQYADMMREAYKEDPIHTNHVVNGDQFIYRTAKKDDKADSEKTTVPTFEGDVIDEDKIYQYKDPTRVKDMRDGYEYTIERIKTMKNPRAKRHTGPGAVFKYMMDAGYEWVGAETMYSSMEPLLAFLRGASLDRNQNSMGVHHALQWSSSPHDAPEHIRRYRLALYVSYMQGVTEINTEEGLWRLEEYYSYFNRHSETCRAHLCQQQDFYRYISTHTRRGKFYTPLAMIHGRCDGWHSFGSDSSWGFMNYQDTDADKSWHLFRTIYPESRVGNQLYFHNCPTNQPLGYYSSTPICNVDALPIEARVNRFSEYKAIAFMGYNLYSREDMDKLADYVRGGGRLLMTRAHTATTTLYDDIKNNSLLISTDHPLGFTDGEPIFEYECFNGEKIPVCKNIKAPDSVIAYTENNTPLLCSYKLGKGELLLVNAAIYPAHDAIRNLYSEQLTALAEYATEDEAAWVYTNDKVESAVYLREDGSRDIYLIAVDWYADVERMRSATLNAGNYSYEITIPFGVMYKITTDAKTSAYSKTENAEVISVSNGAVTVQGEGVIDFYILSEGKEKTVRVDFSQNPIQTIE